MKPDLLDSFVWGGENIKVEWFELNEKSEIPDLPWVRFMRLAIWAEKFQLCFTKRPNRTFLVATPNLAKLSKKRSVEKFSKR